MDIVKIDSVPREILSLIICDNGKYMHYICKNVNSKWYRAIHKFCKSQTYQYIMNVVEYESMRPSEACVHAIVHGYAKTIDWLKDQLVLNIDVVNSYATNGDWIAVKRLREFKFPWSKDTHACACMSGDLTLVKWLTRNWCPFNNLSSMFAAAIYGHLNILKYLFTLEQPNLNTCTTIYDIAHSHNRVHICDWVLKKQSLMMY